MGIRSKIAKREAAKIAAEAVAKKAAKKAPSFAVDKAPVKTTKKAERENMRSLSVFKPPSVEPIVTQAGRLNLPLGGAEQMAFAHPSAHGPYANVAPRIPESGLSAVYENTVNMGKRPTFPIEKLENSLVVPLWGDRTAAGVTLKELNGTPLDVRLYGGPLYGDANAAQKSKAIWASEKGTIGAIRNKAQRGLDAGKDVYAVYTGMGPQSGDQSDMMLNTLLQQIPQSPILKKNLAVFNNETRRYIPKFAGVDHPDAYQQLLGVSQGQRNALVDQMDNAKRLAEGFPDASAARWAITQPEMRQMPLGASGLSVFKLGPDSLQPHTPTLVHPTYPTQMVGEPMGAFENQVPFDMLYPDFFNARRAAGKPGGSDPRSFERSKPSQLMRPEHIDRLAEYLEAVKRGQ